jgi:cytochrome c5
MFVNRHVQAKRYSSRKGIPKRSTTAIVLLLLLPVAHAQPRADQRSGKDVVETVCSSCHATGAGGAPKIGDRKAWNKRSSQGLTSLTQGALKGIRQMPPHGGNPGLTDLEIQRAITYMVNQSGGRWKEPIDKSAPLTQRSAEAIVRTQCAKCHEPGVGGAPRIGDRAAWFPRLNMGFDKVVRSAINGHGGMPARGGMADLTDEEVRSAVTYMFNPPTTSAR